jgi:hypothetical protein
MNLRSPLFASKIVCTKFNEKRRRNILQYEDIVKLKLIIVSGTCKIYKNFIHDQSILKYKSPGKFPGLIAKNH